ncbi:hypothetical protein GCM10022199_26960 [Marihabitans asiaticum]|uniref:Coenzyme PQQ synthesis protein D (PqqD) n=1 Tax=Marihabitans asiaticum TaxID=415218 RepID=A0A560WD05_9MICO|nr:PqqD family protein [Marihabitans asiaticum]TWD15508.1 coenzyme PQQ synthesis protein D (PqqD) [Marihabitans asiaticum]
MTQYVVPKAVAVVVHDDTVFAARVPSGPIMVLEGSAAVLWSLVANTTVHDFPRIVAEHFGVAESAIIDDVEAFLVSLVSRGLLTTDSQPFLRGEDDTSA